MHETLNTLALVIEKTGIFILLKQNIKKQDLQLMAVAKESSLINIWTLLIISSLYFEMSNYKLQKL